MKLLWNTEPAVVIGVIASAVVLIAQQLISNDLVTSTGGVNLLHFAMGVVPALAALLIRGKVTPA